MILRWPLLAFVIAASVSIPANADHCVTWSTSWPEVDTSPVLCPEEWLADEHCPGAIYVDNDLCQPECLFSIPFYCEANEIAGLQRHDELVDDTCHGMIQADFVCT